MPRSRLRVNQGEPVGLDLALAQAAYLPRPAPGQREQAHRRNAGRICVLAQAQDRAELRKVVRAEQPPARRTAIADDAGARVPGSFGPMAPGNDAVEHATQYVMTSIRATRLSASVFVEEAGNVGARDRVDAKMAESGQDGAVEIAQGRLHRGQLPRERAPLDVFGGEIRQCRAGSGKGHESPAALPAREEGERGSPRLVGFHRVRLAERDPGGLPSQPEPEHPGPRAGGLDAQHEALQGGIVDCVFALGRSCRERERIGQAGGLGHRPASTPSSMSARPRETQLAASNTEPSARCA